MADEREGVFLVGVCPTCTVTRIRSKKPITKPEDCKPENFTGVDGAPDPIGEVPLCHECSAVLVFAKEASTKAKPRPPKSEEQKIAEAQTPSIAAVVVETIFQLDADETIFNMEKIGFNEYLVITSKKIVRVRF